MDEPCRTSFQKTLEVADCAIEVEVIWGELDSGGLVRSSRSRLSTYSCHFMALGTPLSHSSRRQESKERDSRVPCWKQGFSEHYLLDVHQAPRAAMEGLLWGQATRAHTV